MHNLHLLVGAAFMMVFLATGFYMHSVFPELYAGREEVRMMYRATHIYILMGTMVNLMAAAYLSRVSASSDAPKRNALKSNGIDNGAMGNGIEGWRWWVIRLKCLASCFILISPALFTVAFFIEPADYLIDRPVSFMTVIALFSGVALHTVINLVEQKFSDQKIDD